MMNSLIYLFDANEINIANVTILGQFESSD